MLTIYVNPNEMYNDSKNEFLYFDGGILQLEHSLEAVRKWEARWHIPFLETDEKTYKQIRDYIRCMTLNPVKDPNIYMFLTRKNIDDVVTYIKNPMTATWFSNTNNYKGGKQSAREKITAELIYYWMISLNIPHEYERWHLNQLMTLIKVITEKNKKQEKRSPQEIARERQRLNEERKKQYNTRG